MELYFSGKILHLFIQKYVTEFNWLIQGCQTAGRGWMCHTKAIPTPIPARRKKLWYNTWRGGFDTPGLTHVEKLSILNMIHMTKPKTTHSQIYRHTI